MFPPCAPVFIGLEKRICEHLCGEDERAALSEICAVMCWEYFVMRVHTALRRPVRQLNTAIPCASILQRTRFRNP
jgi:hypothetical protein